MNEMDNIMNDMVENEMIEEMAMANKESQEKAKASIAKAGDKVKNGAPQVKKANASVVKYETDTVNLKSEVSIESSLRELKTLQQQCIADYKEWANHEVKYTDMSADDKATAAKMKKCNDSYTMSMLMNCMAPLGQGVDVQSLLSSWVTFKVAEMMNPNLKQDTSRLLANFRTELNPMVENLAKEHPVFGKMISKTIDKSMSDYSSKLMSSEIRKSEAEGTIDDLVMTPRQVAALKLNFMEQYYVDTRQFNPNYTKDSAELDNLKKQYDTAIKHLENIANNGNFDMSVVAEEERYLVGLKASENPNYLNLFQETSDVYAAKPHMTDYEHWAGDFETADGHAYTVGDDAANGAFTVREIPKFSDLAYAVGRRGEQFATMMRYLDSDSCELPSDTRKQVKKALNYELDTYKESLQTMFEDDSLAYGDKGFKQFWHDTFETKYNGMMKGEMGEMDFAKEEDAIGKDFRKEFNRIIDKHCAKQLGLEVHTLPGGDIDYEALSAAAKDYVTQHNDIDTRTGSQILEDVRKNFLDDMEPNEVAQLMLHTGANMEQGYMRRKSYGHGGLDATQQQIDEFTKGEKNDSPSTQADGGKSESKESKKAPIDRTAAVSDMGTTTTNTPDVEGEQPEGV